MKKGNKKNRVFAGIGALIFGGAIGTGLFVFNNGDNDLILKTNAMEPSVIEEKNEIPEEISIADVQQADAEEKEVGIQEEKEVVATEEVSQVEVKEEIVEKETPAPSQVEATQPKQETKVETSTNTSTESIAFQTVRQNDSSLEKGKEAVAQEGQHGVLTITYKETYENGVLVSKDVVSSNVTKQPVNRIVNVGTKEKTSNASAALTSVGFAVAGNNYSYITNLSGVVVTAVVNNDRVTNVTFDGTSYYTWKYVGKEMLINQLGQEEGTKRYNEIQQDMKQTEVAILAVANAVHGKGTSKANALYLEILNGGASQNVYSKSF